jgi:hypothetical protein
MVTASLPRTDEPLRVVYHFPGRLRVRADRLREEPEVARAVGARLDEQDGVRDHHVSPLTGSLLVHYDAHEVQLPHLVHAIVDAGGFSGVQVDFSSADLPAEPAGVKVRKALDRFNTKIRTASRNGVDLRTAAPGTLAGMGVFALVFGRRLMPNWYDLLFWSFVTFVNLNPPVPEGNDPQA